MKKEALRVSGTIPVAPTTLYLAWLSSEQHSAMTDSTAKLDPVVGTKYSALDGYVSGKLVTLDLGRRLIMSWRTTDFPKDAPDSRVEIHLEALGGSTRVTILHTEIPEGQSEQYRSTWNDKYITPMRNFFSKYLPDPRKPPPPRPPPPPESDYEEEEEEIVDKKKLGKLKGGKVVAPPSKKAPAPPPKKAAAAPPPSKKAAAPAPSKKAPPPPPSKAAKPAPKKAAEKAPAKKPAAPAKKPAAPAKKPAAKPAPKKPAAKKPAAKPTKKKK